MLSVAISPFNSPFAWFAANFSFCFPVAKLSSIRDEIIVGTDLHARLRDNLAIAENGGGSSRLHHDFA